MASECSVQEEGEGGVEEGVGKVKRALDLFSGTGAVSTRLSQWGYDVVSLDADPSCSPNICADILKWKYKDIPKGYFKLICAGVPCTEYSQAKTVGERNLVLADKIVMKVLEIIEFFEARGMVDRESPDWHVERPAFYEEQVFC